MFNIKDDEKNFITLGKNILKEDDLQFTATYKGEIFTLKYPTPYEKAQIEVEIARRLNGLPRASYPETFLVLLEATVTIDCCYTEKCPKWFKGPWTCYDEEVIVALWKSYVVFRDQFQNRLKLDYFEKNSKS